jgi:beta-N-acetylhexosaminidase
MKYLRLAMVLSFSCLLLVSGCGQNSEEKITALVESLKVEELVGQTLMVGFRDSKNRSFENSNYGLKELIKKYKIGNIILYKDNFNLKLEGDQNIQKSVFDVTRSLQEAAFYSQENKKKIPLFVAIDQEGGAKVRLDKGVTQVPDPMYIGASRSEQYAYDAGWIIGSEMKKLGFNLILAPVADINSNTEETAIGKRSFGAHKDIVSPLCVQFMKGIKEAGILAVGKHFPGHGNTKKDPHYDLPILRHKDRSQLMNIDIAPFKRLIDNGVDAIMTSHLLAPPIERKYPVTISEKANKELLRKELNFNGLIIADDFSVMKGILKDETGDTVRTIEEATIAAYAAGNDIIIYGWIEKEEPEGSKRGISLKKFDEIYNKIIEHFKKNQNRKELLERVKRIITAKTRISKIEDFNNFSTWQASYYNDDEFLKLSNKNEEISKKIAKDSMVLITESGNVCNDMAESIFFRDGKGPLNDDRLLKSDKILLVSPVFTEDELTDAVHVHEKRFLPIKHIETIKLLWIKYGWYEKEQLDDACEYWKVQLEPLAKTNSDGKLEYNQRLLKEKVEEIKKKAKEKRLIIFGAAERDHIEVLKSLAQKIENTPILVLLFSEPYLIPKDIYDKKNISVVSLPSIPNMSLVADLLYGNIQPKDVANLPFSIPGLIDRSKDKGASPIPIGNVTQPPPPTDISPIWWSLLSGLIGAFLFFVIPRGKLTWAKTDTSQYNITDLSWTLIVGLATAVIFYFIFPFLSKLSIGGIDFGHIIGSNVFRYVITGVLSFFSPAMWLKFIKAISS